MNIDTKIINHIDDTWEQMCIKSDHICGIIRITNLMNNTDFYRLDDRDNNIVIGSYEYPKIIRNYMIDKIKNTILDEITTNNTIYIYKTYADIKRSFKRVQYTLEFILRSKQFAASPYIEKATVFVEKNKFTNKIINACINYGFLTIPISNKIKFV